MTPENQETALQILQLETQLQQVSEQVKAQIEFYNQTKASIENLKQKLKNETTGKVKQSFNLGDNTLDLSIYDTNRVTVADEDLVPPEYATPVELKGVYQTPDGRFFKNEPNTKLAANIYKAGGDLPEGFTVKTSRSISIKFNGETL